MPTIVITEPLARAIEHLKDGYRINKIKRRYTNPYYLWVNDSRTGDHGVRIHESIVDQLIHAKLVDGAQVDPRLAHYPGTKRVYRASGKCRQLVLGPCRFGQYHRFHRLVLDDIGFQHLPIYSPNQDETLYNDLSIMGSQFTRLAWQGVVAVDLLMKKLLDTRPYEKEKGRADQVYGESLKKVCEAIEHRGDLKQALDQSLKVFNRIEVNGSGIKPLIGIVGEDLCPAQSVQQRRCDPEDRTVRRRSMDSPHDRMDSVY